MANVIRSRSAVLQLETDTNDTFITFDSRTTDITLNTSLTATSIDGVSELVMQYQTQKNSYSLSLSINLDSDILDWILDLQADSDERDYRFYPMGSTSGNPEITGTFVVSDISQSITNASHQTASVTINLNSFAVGTAS